MHRKQLTETIGLMYYLSVIRIYKFHFQCYYIRFYTVVNKLGLSCTCQKLVMEDAWQVTVYEVHLCHHQYLKNLIF